MDGTRAVHDLHRIDARGEPTFNRIKGTLDMLLAHGVEANVLCVVTEPLARKARDAWQALAPYGYVQFIPCLDALDGAASPWSLTEEGYALFLNETFALYAQAIAQGRYVSVRTLTTGSACCAAIRRTPAPCGALRVRLHDRKRRQHLPAIFTRWMHGIWAISGRSL